MAVRTAISRWRASERASSRLATLAQAMSSTKATATISMSSAGRKLPTSSTSSGLTSTPRFSFVVGIRLLETPRDGVELRLRGADATSRSQAREHLEAAIAALGQAPRRSRSSRTESRLGASLSPRKPAGMTPMTV